jgi:tRNA(Ile)-lysidine synthase
MDLSYPGLHPVPAWQGAFVVQAGRGPGAAAARLQDVELRPRRGGERFALARGALPRSLKKQYQARRVPVWERAGPLLYADGELLYVPGLGIDARCHDPGRGRRLQVRFLPDAPR